MTASSPLAVAAAAIAGYGTFLAYTAVAAGWTGVGTGPRPSPSTALGTRLRQRLGVALGPLLPATVGSAIVGAALSMAVFGPGLPMLTLAAVAAWVPIATARHRRRRDEAVAQEAWPRLIEEIRVLTGAAGQSIPNALFEAGRRAPPALQPAFSAAHREWLLSTDLDHSLTVLKALLADATADAACETLLVAHELGGVDLARRLTDLAQDRRQDTQDRKDARSRQAGVRFARRFVLFVPAGMALVGLSLGPGRSAYQTATGQLMVLIGTGLVAACWLWAGQLMRLPGGERAFAA